MRKRFRKGPYAQRLRPSIPGTPALRGGPDAKELKMELPSRARGDILLPQGEMTRIRQSLRKLSARNDLSTVIACAFDHRTRILPFIYADLKMVPAGVRSIGAVMVDAGFEKTRIDLQQWNRNF